MRDYTDIVKSLAGVTGPRLSQRKARKIITDCLSSIGIIVHNLHRTYTVVRTRRNENLKYFTSTAELSYRPTGIAGRTQRANTGQTSLFYASSCERREFYPQIRTFTDEEYGLKVALFETLSELRDNYTYGYGLVDPSKPRPAFRVRTRNEIRNILVTYGVWETSSDIRLASVCPDSTHDEDGVNQNLRRYMLNSYVMADPFKRLKEHIFWEYLAYEFSNLSGINSNTCDYTVSAIAAEILCEMGFDGVSYPSTRCDGRGINVAIMPDVTDARLRCTKVGLIRVNADDGELLIGHENSLELTPGKYNFDLQAASE